MQRFRTTLAPASFAIAILLGGCSGSSSQQSSATSAPTQAASAAAPQNNGQSIFLTGKDADGTQIAAKSKPLYPSCAACHGANGAGGHHLPGGAISADLRHAALASGDHPYTEALLERAISTGIDNDGKPLDAVMPRWQLSHRDLRDVATYVYTQLK